jgi:hypothetical protein
MITRATLGLLALLSAEFMFIPALGAIIARFV